MGATFGVGCANPATHGLTGDVLAAATPKLGGALRCLGQAIGASRTSVHSARMLILPPGHAQAVRQRRPFRPREKWMVGGVLAVVAALVIVLAISVGTTDKQSGPGCVSVSLAYSTGGDHIYRCGGAARSLCAGAGKAGGITGEPAKTVEAACRKAGLPIG